MSKKTSAARHRAVPTRTNPLAAAGKPAAVAVAVSGMMLGAALPAQASGEIQVAPVTAQQVSGTYTVQAGDTLGSIAAAHGLNVNDLFTANGLGNASVIYPGQALSLSVSAAPQQYSLQAATIVPTQVAAPVAVPAPVVAAPVAEVVAAPATFTPAPVAAPAAAQSGYSLQAPAGSITPITNGGAAAPVAAPPVAGGGIVGTAMQGVGGSYVYGGTGFKAWDCSGFVQWAYAQNGISLPRTTWAQFGSMRATGSPQPGDLVSQNGGSHVGIYLGNGQMISALNPAQATQVHSVNAMQLDGYYTR